MRVFIALGGNALLERGQPLTVAGQRERISLAAEQIGPLSQHHDLVISHGNGPQVGILELQALAYGHQATYPLDVLGAHTQGMIGYLIAQSLGPKLVSDRSCVGLLTQVLVDPMDPAFKTPDKPIGPIYEEAQARAIEQANHWLMQRDGTHFRRVVPSPRPIGFVELEVIRTLVDLRVVVICAGGGGTPVTRMPDGTLRGLEAVVDKDWASALLAHQLGCDGVLFLTDVQCVYENWWSASRRGIRRIGWPELKRRRFNRGTMGPKVEAAVWFVEHGGNFAAIGGLDEVADILAGTAGTRVDSTPQATTWWR